MKLALALFILCQSVVAATGAKVVLLKGKAFFNGNEITKESILDGKGTFTLGDKSYLKLQLQSSGTVIVLGANSKSTMNLSEKELEPELDLVKGTARWITGSAKKPGGGIKTTNAVMGIRGTDFYVSFNPAFQESEVVCFDGSVQLTNQNNIADSKTIKKNQWGGIGGRFGKKLSDILTLEPAAVTWFKNELPLE